LRHNPSHDLAVLRYVASDDRYLDDAIARAPAAEVEKLVVATIIGARPAHACSVADAKPRKAQIPGAASAQNGLKIDRHADGGEPEEGLRDAIERVIISQTMIEIRLADPLAAENPCRVLTAPWTAPSPFRRREIIQGQGGHRLSIRPMPVRARVVLLEALRYAHRWLDELMSNPSRSIETIAAREGKTERSIRMTLSLAFLAPPIVKAAIEGRLPRGFGVTRLIDPPMAWANQWAALGLTAPTPN
jgi:hypothetical protein